MKVRADMYVEMDCTNHVGTGEKHYIAKELIGGECIPGFAHFFQIWDESEVMERAKMIMDMGHTLELTYLQEEK